MSLAAQRMNWKTLKAKSVYCTLLQSLYRGVFSDAKIVMQFTYVLMKKKLTLRFFFSFYALALLLYGSHVSTMECVCLSIHLSSIYLLYTILLQFFISILNFFQNKK